MNPLVLLSQKEINVLFAKHWYPRRSLHKTNTLGGHSTKQWDTRRSLHDSQGGHSTNQWQPDTSLYKAVITKEDKLGRPLHKVKASRSLHNNMIPREDTPKQSYLGMTLYTTVVILDSASIYLILMIPIEFARMCKFGIFSHETDLTKQPFCKLHKFDEIHDIYFFAKYENKCQCPQGKNNCIDMWIHTPDSNEGMLCGRTHLMDMKAFVVDVYPWRSWRNTMSWWSWSEGILCAWPPLVAIKAHYVHAHPWWSWRHTMCMHTPCGHEGTLWSCTPLVCHEGTPCACTPLVIMKTYYVLCGHEGILCAWPPLVVMKAHAYPWWPSRHTMCMHTPGDHEGILWACTPLVAIKAHYVLVIMKAYYVCTPLVVMKVCYMLLVMKAYYVHAHPWWPLGRRPLWVNSCAFC